MSNPRVSILKKLRPPFTQAVKVIYSFTRTATENYGLTLAVTAGQPLVAPGDGIVDMIAASGTQWHNDLVFAHSVAVRIDHGCGIKTYVRGLRSAAVRYGPVTRGTLLGRALQEQVFFGAEFNEVPVDPTHINKYFGFMDGVLGSTKGGKLHQAPDVITSAVSLIESLLWQGALYFLPTPPIPILLNLDFNGQGAKSGAAAIGEPGDAWNKVPALDFSPFVNSVCPYYGLAGQGGYLYCCGGVTFPDSQGVFLNDFRGQATKVWLERGVLTAAAGQTPFFDPMLSSWVGGYTGITPKLNSFTLRNLPAGTYDLYLYSNGGATADSSTFYCSVDHGAPTIQVATPTLAAAWVQDGNYVKFTGLAVTTKGSVTIAAYGYLAGLQLLRS